MDSVNHEGTKNFENCVKRVGTLCKKEQRLNLGFKMLLLLVIIEAILAAVSGAQRGLHGGKETYWSLIAFLGFTVVLGSGLWWVKAYKKFEELDRQCSYTLDQTLYGLSRKKKIELCQEAGILDWYKKYLHVDHPREGYRFIGPHWECKGEGWGYRNLSGICRDTGHENAPPYWCTECGWSEAE